MFKRKTFTLEEKYLICCRLENGETNVSLAKELEVSHSTLSSIWKKRDEIKGIVQKGDSLKKKKLRNSTNENVDQLLLKWFKIQRSRNIPISGPILLAKANDFLKSIPRSSRESSESEEIISRSWVQRFCVRHAIVFKKLSGEAAGVPSATSDDWLAKVWPTIREGYSDSDVFNADETGLFYKLTPDRTLHFKGEKCSNGKLSKERITVLVAANMSGSEKRKLFVIGKSKNPRCFKNVKNLPVDYYNNQKAWMTTDLFNKFLLDWDKELKKKRRKILLLIDNCPSHINLRDFEFIKVVFLPPNTTSVLQPMDQGIIQKIKTNFRKQLVLRFLQDVEENRETKISILDAIIMVHQAWEDVPATTIKNCFKHSGVLGNQNEEQPSEPAEINALDEPEFLPWSESLELPTIINKDVLADYAKIDEGLHTEQDISDEDLINELDADIETDNGEEDEEEQLDIPPLTDALRAAQLLKKFVMCDNQFCTQNIKSGLDEIEKKISREFYLKKCKKQKVITDYFSARN